MERDVDTFCDNLRGFLQVKRAGKIVWGMGDLPQVVTEPHGGFLSSPPPGLQGL